MKLDDVLQLLESEIMDERNSRRKAVYFDLHEADEKQYQFNRKSKRDFDDETNDINQRNKHRSPRYDRAKRL